MRPKALFLVVALCAAAVSHAQQSLSLVFPDAAEREIWIAADPSAGPGQDSVRTSQATADVPMGSHKASEKVYVWDKTSGNLASLPVSNVKLAWNVDAKAYKDVAAVKVRVEHSGQALASGEVTVDDGAHPQKQLLDPTNKGELTFFDVKPGSLKVTARYKAGKDAKSVTQLVDVPLGRKDPTPTAVLSVPEDVATVGATTPAPASPKAEPKAGGTANDADVPPADLTNRPKENPGSAVGSLVGVLIGLVLACVIGYCIYRYAQQNQDLVKSRLQQMGVDIPQPGDNQAPLDPVTPIAQKRPDPPQKIILDDAAPLPTSNPAPMGGPIGGQISLGSSAVSTGEPRLVAEDGSEMPLMPGETVVGREAGLGLSLVGESTISRRHANLVRNGSEVVLTDQGSTNGTYVNGARLSAPTVLRPGDAVQFGSVRFRYEG